MIRALRVVWLAFKDLFDEFALLMICNLLWSLLSLPLVVATGSLLRNGLWLPALLLSLVAIVPLAPATVALCAVANDVSEGIVSSWRKFFAAVRRYAVPSWKAFGIWQLGLLLILVDIWFYGGMANFLGITLMVFWCYMLLIWLALLLYFPPLLVVQEGIDVRTLARSSGSMVFGRPLFTLVLLVLTVALTIVSAIFGLPLVVLTVALLALIGIRATRSLLAEAEAAREAAAAAQAAPESRERGRRGQVRPRE